MSINRPSTGYTVYYHQGQIVAGGSVEFIVSGDPSTQKPIFTDDGLTTPATNPQSLNLYGEIEGDVFVDDSYGYILRDADDNVLRTVNDCKATSGVSSASTSTAGVVELATSAETVTGTDSQRAVTPDGLTDRLAEPGVIGGTTPNTVNASSITTTGDVTVGGDVLPDNDSEDDLGSTADRWQHIYADALTLTGGLNLDDSSNTGVADAYGLITAATTIVGQGFTSVSTSATGVHTVTFENAADSTDEQLVMAQSEGTSPMQNTTTLNSTTTATIRAWLDSGGSLATFNNYPIAVVRWLFT